jgi:hypothetical protein
VIHEILKLLLSLIVKFSDSSAFLSTLSKALVLIRRRSGCSCLLWLHLFMDGAFYIKAWILYRLAHECDRLFWSAVTCHRF